MEKLNAFSTIFIHVPKTAGTTLRTIIESIYPEDQMCMIYSGDKLHAGMDDFYNLPDNEKVKFRILCGHFDFGLHRQLPQKCKYITILRDPVERTISLYHHYMQKENARFDKGVAKLQKRIASEGLALDDFVSGVTADTDNKQVRLLTGDAPSFGNCTRTMLEKAKKNLRQHFILAGVTERFDESLVLMQQELDWPTPYYVKENISANRAKKEDVPPSTLAKILKYNELDIELYQFAHELMDEKISEKGPSFQVALEKFRTGNLYFAKSMQRLQIRIDDLMNSWSWKVSAPLRKAMDILNDFHKG